VIKSQRSVNKNDDCLSHVGHDVKAVIEKLQEQCGAWHHWHGITCNKQVQTYLWRQVLSTACSVADDFHLNFGKFSELL
jgi:adenylosuccinate lyase